MAKLSLKSKKKQIRDYAELVAKQMLLWAKNRYKLDEKILNLTLIVSFKPNRIYSYGGWHKTKKGCKPYLNLALDSCIRYKPDMIQEYDWYKNDPVIGQRYATTWKYYVRMLVAHEVAHTIQYAHYYLTDSEQKDRLRTRFGRSKLSDEGHGEDFQKIYRILRRKYVNRISKRK